MKQPKTLKCNTSTYMKNLRTKAHSAASNAALLGSMPDQINLVVEAFPRSLFFLLLQEHVGNSS